MDSREQIIKTAAFEDSYAEGLSSVSENKPCRTCWMLPFISPLILHRIIRGNFFSYPTNGCKYLTSKFTVPVKHNSLEYVLEGNTSAAIVTAEFFASAVAKDLV